MENVSPVLEPTAPEFLRYFSPRDRCLVSCREDGTVHVQRWGESWRLFARKKPAISLADWQAAKHDAVSRLPAWAAGIAELPTQAELEEWIFDGLCETPSGDSVEPDGVGPDGAPSWLRCLGLI